MWKRKGVRTNPAEVARLLHSQALILAEIDGALVGSVAVFSEERKDEHSVPRSELRNLRNARRRRFT
jgi:hypothetical protein